MHYTETMVNTWEKRKKYIHLLTKNNCCIKYERYQNIKAQKILRVHYIDYDSVRIIEAYQAERKES